MDRVLDRLFIGSAVDLDGRVPLHVLGFSAVVDLRDVDRPVELLSDVAVHRLPNRDGDPWTAADAEAALGFIHVHVRKGRVLVACMAGMSRSACIVAAYLVRCGWSLTDAVEHVRRVRPIVAPLGRMLESALAAALGLEDDQLHAGLKAEDDSGGERRDEARSAEDEMSGIAKPVGQENAIADAIVAKSPMLAKYVQGRAAQIALRAVVDDMGKSAAFQVYLDRRTGRRPG